MPNVMVVKYKRLLFIIIFVAIVIGIDLIRISNYQTFPQKPAHNVRTYESQLYWDLVNSKENIDWTQLDATLDYISHEYDCSDFKLVNLIRILYEFNDEIPDSYRVEIRDVLTRFRYWLDEPGENSMCYWSENHQILFASAEYLIASKYSDLLFPNTGLDGHAHMQQAKTRILEWLKMRWNYGFTEFYSDVYYKEDIAALVNLIDFSEDEEIVLKSKIVLDLLFYDVATQSSQGMFVSTSGRAYESGRKGPRNLGGLTRYFWGDGKELKPNMLYGLTASSKYVLPPVIQAIALDTSTVISKQTNGLDIADLKAEGFADKTMSSLMMQWGMEAFVNPLVVRQSLSYMRKYHMFSNAFLRDFKMLDFTLLRLFYLEPLLVRLIKPQYTGTAIQQGNTYTYRTKDYSLYTAQAYHVGDFADQHHISGMNIGGDFSIFHSHPAVEEGVEGHSPNYWVGYGHLPHSVQDKNVNLSIYNIPKRKGIMENDLLDYTHAYFPKEKFDTISFVNNYVFGKKGDAYCAFIGRHNLNFREGTKDDIIQKGKTIYWITEAGSKSLDGSFDAFVQRILNNKLQFTENSLTLSYCSNGNTYDLVYDTSFKVNGQLIDTDYQGFDSPYLRASRKSKVLKISCEDNLLHLDFDKMIRSY